MKNLKRIKLDGCNNLRDLGGYEGVLGSTRWHTCYRCDLPLLNKEGWDYLYENCNLRCVIDLRSSAEQEMQTYDNQNSNINYIHIPLIKEEARQDGMKAFAQSMAESYLQIILHAPENVVSVLTQIATTLQQDGAVLYHCTAGKDRTGIISFILLRLCGVENSDIMADYQVSSTYNFYGNSSSNELLKAMANTQSEWMHSNPEALGNLISYFAEHDIEDFLLEHGMRQEDIKIIKEKLQE